MKILLLLSYVYRFVVPDNNLIKVFLFKKKMNDLKKQLVDELSKYSGFRAKTDIKSTISEAISQVQSKDLQIPIKQADSPIIRAFSLIFKSSTNLKLLDHTCLLLCDLVQSGFFGLKLINESFAIIENFCKLSERDTALRILQFVAHVLPRLYKDHKSVNSIFSISLTLLQHSDSVVSTTAFASSQQMFSVLFDLVEKCESIPKPVVNKLNLIIYRNKSRRASTVTPSSSQTDLTQMIQNIAVPDNDIEVFVKDINKIPYLLLNDICNILYHRPTEWLNVATVQDKYTIKLWDIIISTHSDFMKSCKAFLDVLETSVALPMTSRDFLPFYASCVSNYVDVLPSTITSIYSFFISLCSKDSDVSAKRQALTFFRTVYSSYPNFASEFYVYCEHSIASLTSVLLENLLGLLDGSEKEIENVINLSIQHINNINNKEIVLIDTKENQELNQQQINDVKPEEQQNEQQNKVNQQTNIIKAPISAENPQNIMIFYPLEISLCICHCNNKQLISKNWQNLTKLIIYCFRYSTLETSDIVIESISKLIHILYEENEMDNLRVLYSLTHLVVVSEISPKNMEDDLDQSESIEKSNTPEIGSLDKQSLEYFYQTLLLSNRRRFFFRHKRLFLYQMIINMFTSNYKMFLGFFKEIIDMINVYKDEELSLAFSKEMDLEALQEFVSYLVRDVNNFFNVYILDRIFVLNLDKFPQLWRDEVLDLCQQPIKPESLLEQLHETNNLNENVSQSDENLPIPTSNNSITNSQSYSPRLSASNSARASPRMPSNKINKDRITTLLDNNSIINKNNAISDDDSQKYDIMEENFENTLAEIAQILIDIIETSDYVLVTKIYSIFLNKQELNDYQTEKGILIDALFTKLQQPPSAPQEAWPYIIKAFNPETCSNTETIRKAFSGFSYIVRNTLKEVRDEDISLIIQTTFSFVDQTIDINIALSALELLWVITPRMEHSEKLFVNVLSKSFSYLTDERNAIAATAVDTPFSLISSNSEELSDDAFKHLLNNCLIPLLENLTNFSIEGQWQVLQKTFLNTCHCAIVFWNRYEKNNTFLTKFWPLLIRKQTYFCKECKNDEVSFDALLFYVEALGCKSLPKDLREKITISFNEVICWYTDHEPVKSLALQSMGRIFSNLILSEKEHITERNVHIWLSTVKKMLLTLHSETKLQMSCLKVVECIPRLFPAKDFFLYALVKYISDIIENAPYEPVRVAMVDLSINIIEKIRDDSSKIVHFSKSLSNVLNYPCSSKLVETLIDINPALNEKETEEFFMILLHAYDCQNEKLTNYLIMLFPKVSDNARQSFIKSCLLDEKTLETIWVKYCDPSSDSFSKEIYNNCFADLFDMLTGMIGELSVDEKKICNLLQFFEQHAVCPKTIGLNTNCKSWHLIQLIPQLMKLFEDRRKKVSLQAQKLLKLIKKDLDIIVANPPSK